MDVYTYIYLYIYIYIYFYLFIWLHQVLIVALAISVAACGMALVPHRDQTQDPALGAQSLSHWITEEVLDVYFSFDQSPTN